MQWLANFGTGRGADASASTVAPLDAKTAAVVDAIDHCLEHHILHTNVNKALRHITSTIIPDRNGEVRLTRIQLLTVVPLMAQELQVPTWLFDDVGELFDRFDVDGDGTLDEVEAKRLFKKVLQQRRSELGGRRKMNVPYKTVTEAGYTIVKELGRGGQGTMYLATKPTWYFTTQEYCIKFYDKSCANAGGIDELMDEYELMKGLTNAHIAKTYEVFQDRLFFYLVNEPYFGGDLTKLGKAAFDKGVHMSENWWREIFRQCLDGVAYLHSKGVMHCDIKEPNIMIARDDSYASPAIVLIDFGLSSAFTSTREGVCGTPGYIPPETWQSGIWYDKGDVFSLGVVFFQLMTGQVPSKNGAVQGVLIPLDGSEDFAKSAATQPLPWQLFPEHEMPLLAELLELMICRQRNGRPKAAQALQHAWLLTKSDAPMPIENVELLVGIAAGHQIQDELAQQLRATNNLDQLRSVRYKFETADPLGRGVVDSETAFRILAEHGVSRQVAKASVTAGGGGQFPYDVLTSEAIAAKERHGFHYLKDLFDELDRDHSGTLSFDELRPLLGSTAFEFPAEQIDDLMAIMDPDGDGIVTFDEFSQACLQYGRISGRAATGSLAPAGRLGVGRGAPRPTGSTSTLNQGLQSATRRQGHSSMALAHPRGVGRFGGYDVTFDSPAKVGRVGLSSAVDVGRPLIIDGGGRLPTFEELIGRGWVLRIVVVGARGLRASAAQAATASSGGPSVPGAAAVSSFAPCHPFCSCRTSRGLYPAFETPVAYNTAEPRWAFDFQLRNYIVGDELEFIVRSQAGARRPVAPPVPASNDVDDRVLLGVATLRCEHFFPHGFASELTLLRPGLGIAGLLQVQVSCVEEDWDSVGLPLAPAQPSMLQRQSFGRALARPSFSKAPATSDVPMHPRTLSDRIALPSFDFTFGGGNERLRTPAGDLTRRGGRDAQVSISSRTAPPPYRLMTSGGEVSFATRAACSTAGLKNNGATSSLTGVRSSGAHVSIATPTAASASASRASRVEGLVTTRPASSALELRTLSVY